MIGTRIIQQWLARRVNDAIEIPGPDGEPTPYMRRYYLLGSKIKSDPGWGLRVHELLLSDPGRDLHDHPWDFWSIGLWGSYEEELSPGQVPYPDGMDPSTWRRRWRAPWIRRMKAESLHRLHLRAGRHTWTLVFHGRKRREWGFMTPNGWVHHQTYDDLLSLGAKGDM